MISPRSLFVLGTCALACGSDDAGSSAGTTEMSSSGDASSGTTSPNVDGSSSSVGTTEADGTSDSSGTTHGESSGSSGSSDEDSGSDSSGGEPAWSAPTCRTVTGTGAVTFTFDEGQTLAPMDETIVPVTYTFGLVALAQPGALLAGSGGEVLASSDAGCSWHSIGRANAEDTAAVVLRAAGATRAYGFGDNRALVIRVDDEVITTLESPAGDNGIVGLGVDPRDPDRVRLGDSIGRLWESTDAGASWDPLGVPAIAPDSLAYRAYFDPNDPDHVLFGVLVEGIFVSTDGGAQWDAATGLARGNANGFNLVVSPVDGDIVWAEGIALGVPDSFRFIYRSEDGGNTFSPVIDESDADLINGNPLFAHPEDPDVLYFSFGSNFGDYGTDVYRYEHGAGDLTLTHNVWHEVAAITFMPGDPSVMWFGLSIEP